MKKYHFFTPAILLTSVSITNAESLKSESDVMSSDEIDALSSKELYWNRLNAIETSKNTALQLQIQNNNLVKTVEKTGGSPANDLESLKEFLELSISEKELVSEESKSQAELISDYAEDLPHNIDVMGAVNTNGDVISQNSTKDDLAQMQKQQAEFFDEMIRYVNSSLTEVKESVGTNGGTKPPSEKQEEASIQEPNNEQPSQPKEFSYQPKKESMFLPPSGKIKKVTNAGVEIVLAFDLKAEDDGTAFVSALIKEGDKEIMVYPAVRYKIKYSVEHYSLEKIILLSEFDELIVISR